MGPACLGQGWRAPGVPAAPLCVLFPSKQVAPTEDAREGRSISARLPPGAAAAGSREGRAGRSPGCAARPRDRVRTGSARQRAGGGRVGLTGPRARAGREDRERRAGGRRSLSPSNLRRGPRGQSEGAGDSLSSLRAGARASRLGRASALRRGAPRGRSGPLPRGPGRPRAAPGGAAEGPRGARSGFPAAFPGHHRRAGVRAGGVCV